MVPTAPWKSKSFGVVAGSLRIFFSTSQCSRRDHSYTDGRRPERVTPSDPETDARDEKSRSTPSAMIR